MCSASSLRRTQFTSRSSSTRTRTRQRSRCSGGGEGNGGARGYSDHRNASYRDGRWNGTGLVGVGSIGGRWNDQARLVQGGGMGRGHMSLPLRWSPSIGRVAADILAPRPSPLLQSSSGERDLTGRPALPRSATFAGHQAP